MLLNVSGVKHQKRHAELELSDVLCLPLTPFKLVPSRQEQQQHDVDLDAWSSRVRVSPCGLAVSRQCNFISTTRPTAPRILHGGAATHQVLHFPHLASNSEPQTSNLATPGSLTPQPTPGPLTVPILFWSKKDKRVECCDQEGSLSSPWRPAPQHVFPPSALRSGMTSAT